MTLGRSWTRQLFGASGAALLVPGALAGALVALAFAGGFGQLGSLGQALSGPSVPGPARASATLGGVGRSALGRALAAAAATTGATVAGPTRRPAPGAVGGPLPGPSSHPGGSGSGGTGRGGSGAPGGTGGSGGTGGGSGNPGGVGGPPPTPAPPTAVDKLVGVATSVTGQVPGPVGAVATQTMQSVGTTLDRVLPLGGFVAAPLGLPLP